MDHRKIDAALAAALDEPRAAAVAGGPGPRLSVFVHVDPVAASRRRAELARLGLPAGSILGGIGTASLSPDQVRELSSKPWVRQIRLSQPLDTL
ncbi:MAG TPA: hypothetical protein VM390_04385 [Acidimicrobiales bacterium]|nr:hypothetical protein [Acidimicrobiales bacterium]